MPSLKLKSGTAVTVKEGRVEIIGKCACLIEQVSVHKEQLVLAYALADGEVVRRIGEDEYSVDF